MNTWQTLRTHPELWKRYFVREQVLSGIRRFFADRAFHEVETPLLTGSLPPESYLEVFETSMKTRIGKTHRAFLPTSPEPFLKKLLVAGIGNCFSITKSFRNTEDMSLTHNPEFTILEWYRPNADYHDIMDDMEALFRYLYGALFPDADPAHMVYQGQTIDITSPWERVSVTEAFLRYAGIDLSKALAREPLASEAVKKGYAVTDADTWEMLFNQIFLNEIEPFLGRGKPTILFEYPASLAALSRKKTGDPRFAERFEVYIAGLELGDAYSELTDWKEQEERFRAEHEEIRRLGKTDHPVDWDFIEALKTGMPPSGGIAVGVDRLIMLLSDTDTIADTLFFPAIDLFGDRERAD